MRSTIRSAPEDLEDDLTMLIGPDHAGNLREIGVVSSEQAP